MTTTAYNRIKALLIEQRRQVTRSPKKASQLITDLGIRDILVEVPAKKTAPKKKLSANKAVPQKTAAK